MKLSTLFSLLFLTGLSLVHTGADAGRKENPVVIIKNNGDASNAGGAGVSGVVQRDISSKWMPIPNAYWVWPAISFLAAAAVVGKNNAPREAQGFLDTVVGTPCTIIGFGLMVTSFFGGVYASLGGAADLFCGMVGLSTGEQGVRDIKRGLALLTAGVVATTLTNYYGGIAWEGTAHYTRELNPLKAFQRR